MKKNISKVLLVLLSIFTLLNLVACSSNTDEDEAASLTVILPLNRARSIVDSVVRYEVVLQITNGDFRIERDAEPGDTLEFDELTIDEYTISVSAFDKNDKLIAYGENFVVPIPKHYKKDTIMKFIEDFGIEISLDYDLDHITNEIEIVLKPVE